MGEPVEGRPPEVALPGKTSTLYKRNRNASECRLGAKGYKGIPHLERKRENGFCIIKPLVWIFPSTCS